MTIKEKYNKKKTKVCKISS